MTPLVSIVTPTFPGREEELLERCMPSVFGQTHKAIQWVVVSDRNDYLAEAMRDLHWALRPKITFVQINESWRNPVSEGCVGAVPWQIGSLLALGEYVGFLGDDDEYFPDHVTRHLEHLSQPDVDFTLSQFEFRAGGVLQFLVGNDSFAHGHLDSDGLMCKAETLKLASWSVTDGPYAMACDYRLVRDWQLAGARGRFIGDGPTGIHHDGWVVGKTGRPNR